jgi:uncharacterized membrane protein HdeD (DUF308 family)
MSSADVEQVKRMSAGAWGWLVAAGVISLVLGIVSLVWPDATITVLGIVFGLWLGLAGLARLGLAFVMAGWPAWRRVLTGLFGIALVVVGVVALVDPGGSARALAILIGIGFLVAAVADLVLGVSGRGGRGRWATLGLGLINLVLAALFLFWPDTGLQVIAVTLGVVLLVLGVLQIAAGVALRRYLHRMIDDVAGGETRGVSVEIL